MAITLQVVTSTSGSVPTWDSASWIVGSNGSPGCAELDQPLPRDHALELLGDAAEAVVERTVLAGPVDGVEDLDDRGQGLVRRVLAHQVAVALDPALVVDVLGLEPLQVGGPLRELPLDGRTLGLGLVASPPSTSVSLAISAAASPNDPADPNDSPDPPDPSGPDPAGVSSETSAGSACG